MNLFQLPNLHQWHHSQKDMKIKHLLFLTGLAALATSCSSPQPMDYAYVTTGSAPINAVDQNAQTELAQAAVSVDQSLQQLSAIKIATNPQVKMPPPVNPSAIGMAQITTLNWTGPIEPLLKKIAAESGYKVNVLGKEPAIPIIVSINAQNEPLAEILRNITFQADNADNKAQITLYPEQKVIELRYYTQ